MKKMLSSLKDAHLVLLFILLSGSQLVFAQNYIDIVKFDYAITPENSFDSTAVTTALYEGNANLTVPVVINDRFSVLTGVIYESVSASFQPGRADESLAGITLKLGGHLVHNSRWTGTYILLPKFSSDLKKSAKDDFQLGLAVLMKYIKTRQLNYKFGLYINSDQFGPMAVPLFGFYYRSPSEKLEANLLLPLTVDVNYAINNKIRLGLNYKGQIRSYNLNTPLGNELDRYLVKNSQEIYGYFQFEWWNSINCQLGLGRSVGRSYRIYDEKISLGFPLYKFGDHRTQLNTDFSDSWLFKVALFYRLKLGKKNVDTKLK